VNPPDAAALDATPEALAKPEAVAEPDAVGADEPANVVDADAPENGADTAELGPGRDAEFTEDATTLEAENAETEAGKADAADEGP
jgi:hypothetical protein